MALPAPALRAEAAPDGKADWRAFPRHILRDQKAIWTSPFHSNKQEAKYWFLFPTLTAGLIASDHRTAKQLPNTPDQIHVSSITSRFGAAYTVGPAMIALALVGAARGDTRMRETGMLATEAVADTYLVSSALKMATMRERPDEGTGAGRFWKGSGAFWNTGSSFPSGHAMQVWAVASVVAHEYPRPRIIPIAAYSVAAMVMASRVAQQRHFASDVVAGAAAGWFIGNYIFHRRHRP